MRETPIRGTARVEVSPDRVETSEGLLPAEIDYIVTGANGDPDFTAQIKVIDGKPEVVSFLATAKPGGRGLRSVDIGTNVDVIVRSAYEACSMFWRDEEIGKKADRARRGRPAKLTRAVLEEAARIYRDNVGHKPVLAVQEQMELGHRRTAEMYVQRARQAGILPPTTPGKAKA